jgi:tRNA(adenine34) deaminase
MDKAPEQFMREALALAEEALARGEFPIAALVVLGDEVLARATTAEQAEGRYLVHAELLALEEADRLGLTYRQRRKARLFTNLEPCLMCMGAAMSFFLGEIYYALESPADGAVALVQGWSRAEQDMPGYQVPRVTGGLLREESIALFKTYADQRKPGPMRDWGLSLAKLG